jgi:hypothetical protein
MNEYYPVQTDLFKKYLSELRQNFYTEVTQYLFLSNLLGLFFKRCQFPSHERSHGHFVDITDKHEIKKNKCGVASDGIMLIISFMKIIQLFRGIDTTAQWSQTVFQRISCLVLAEPKCPANEIESLPM